MIKKKKKQTLTNDLNLRLDIVQKIIIMCKKDDRLLHQKGRVFLQAKE